jgi:AcrR family transcriptional regulator
MTAGRAGGDGTTESPPNRPNAQSSPSSTHDRLIQAARDAFAAHGLRGATTKTIAEAAGVSEVTLFRHFATKKELFIAVLESYSSISIFNDELKHRLTWNFVDDLTMIASIFVGMTDASTLAMLTSITEAMRYPELRPLVADPPRRQLEFMSWYLREQMSRGACRRLDHPELVAQAFFALFFEHSIGKAIYVENPPEPSAAVRELVGIFVNGVRAAGG